MACKFKINGQLVSEAEYNAYVKTLDLPSIGSKTAAETAGKYSVADMVQSDNAPAPLPPVGASRGFINPDNVRLENLSVPEGAEPEPPAATEIVFQDLYGKSPSEDTRVRIMVPPKYLAGPTEILGSIGGILFPYTPSIGYDAKSEYSPQQPLHSNFAINFYQRSSIGDIIITGKFSVQNEADAEIYIATMHLLKALTRMRSGGAANAGADRGGPSFSDADSGAPPPVCRLFGHGEMMLNNVPVAIANYRIELPDSVDYFTLPKTENRGTSSVPTVSTIAVTCKLMYSRAEMQRFSVTGYLNDNTEYKTRGFI